jgi:uncharacterized membrane protein HdeD (DUF308 family)
MAAGAAGAQPATDRRAVFDDSGSLMARLGPFVERYLQSSASLSWRATGIFGIIVTLCGLPIILNPAFMDSLVRVLTGSLLVLVSLFWLYQTMSESERLISTATSLRMYSAGIALVGGTSLILAEYVEQMSDSSARLTLGFTVIFIGIIGLASIWFRALTADQRLAAIGINEFMILLGVINFIQLRNDQRFFDRQGWLMLAAGCALIVYA